LWAFDETFRAIIIEQMPFLVLPSRSGHREIEAARIRRTPVFHICALPGLDCAAPGFG
jgi:hypothetical protein